MPKIDRRRHFLAISILPKSIEPSVRELSHVLLGIYVASADPWDSVEISVTFVELVAVFVAAICHAGMAARPDEGDIPNGLEPRPGRETSGL